jgi:hypothetical protein
MISHRGTLSMKAAIAEPSVLIFIEGGLADVSANIARVGIIDAYH